MSLVKVSGGSLGKKLRALRREYGVASTRKLSALMKRRYSPEIIARRECGKIKIDSAYLEVFCEALGLEGRERHRVMSYAKTEWLRQTGNAAALSAECWSLRQSAREAHIYTASLIPGGLQTFGYAGALIASYGKCADPCEIARRRLAWGQGRLTDTAKHTRLVCLESALYLAVDSPPIMLEQLDKLRGLADRDHFEFRILPWNVYLDLPLHEAFAVFDGTFCVCETRVGFVTAEDDANRDRLKADFKAMFDAAACGPERVRIIDRAMDYHRRSANSR